MAKEFDPLFRPVLLEVVTPPTGGNNTPGDEEPEDPWLPGND